MQLRKESLKKSGLPGFEPFIFIFPGYITNQFNDQLPVGLLAQLVRALHRYRRGQGSNPGKPDFFRLSFRNCISCVNNCEDLLYICFHNVSLNVLQVSLCAAEEMSHTRVTVFPFDTYNVVRRSSLVNVIFSQPTWNRVTVKIVHAFII